MTSVNSNNASVSVSREPEPNLGLFSDELMAAARRREASLVSGLLAGSDDETLRWMVQFVQQATAAAYVFVGELCGPAADRVRSVAHHGASGRLSDFEYAIKDTPCENVLTQRTCVYPAGVAGLFPRDTLLAEIAIQSYVGVPLADASGHPLGLFVTLGTKALDTAAAQRTRALLEGLRARAGSILIHRRALERLAHVEGQRSVPDRLRQ